MVRLSPAALAALAALAACILVAVVACAPAEQAAATHSPVAAGSSATGPAPSVTRPPSKPALRPITVLPPSSSRSAPTTASSSTVSAMTASAMTASPEATSTGIQTSVGAHGSSGAAMPAIVETTASTGSAVDPLTGADVPAGTVVVIDPGHNGQNAKHPEIINKPVPAGFGQTKACNTTGTSTNAGFAEHALNWQVAVALRELLREHGITVVMTRTSDDGVGPCVDERARIGNDAQAAAVVSIHGDGEKPSASGFFVMTASRAPAGPEIAAATDRLAAAVRDGMVADGFHVSTILGRNGLWARQDLAGLNLSMRPTVMVELGNMRNSAEAKLMSSPAGQQRYARGLARGILAFLGS